MAETSIEPAVYALALGKGDPPPASFETVSFIFGIPNGARTQQAPSAFAKSTRPQKVRRELRTGTARGLSPAMKVGVRQAIRSDEIENIGHGLHRTCTTNDAVGQHPDSPVDLFVGVISSNEEADARRCFGHGRIENWLRIDAAREQFV